MFKTDNFLFTNKIHIALASKNAIQIKDINFFKPALTFEIFLKDIFFSFVFYLFTFIILLLAKSNFRFVLLKAILS